MNIKQLPNFIILKQLLKVTKLITKVETRHIQTERENHIKGTISDTRWSPPWYKDDEGQPRGHGPS